LLTLLLATTSQDKVREYHQILDDLTLRLCTPRELGLELYVEESGRTFRANADLKARAYHAAARGRAIWVLAEDSGLEVRALGGEPGVYSARWADTDDYDVMMRLLLERLDGVSGAQRACRYVCAVTLIGPDGAVARCRGEVRGRLADAPRGNGGFGYDPIFLLPRRRRTMAELSAAEKHAISHRARAARCARRRLQAALGEGGG